MDCTLNSPSLPSLYKPKLAIQLANSLSSFSPVLHTKPQRITSSSCSMQSSQGPATTTTHSPPPSSGTYGIKFQTLEACKLGISRYPDFEYNAKGGNGSATGTKKGELLRDELCVSFDPKTLYIPPLTGSTTRFLGLPLPPFLKIDIVPEVFEGTINQESGRVELQFRAKFWFSVGRLYRAPPLLVETMLTSEESKGAMRSGRGERMDSEGRCRLVGVAVVEPINDILMDSFLDLPTECIADLNAMISMPSSS